MITAPNMRHGRKVASTTEALDARGVVLRNFLQHELSAPGAAIAGFLEMMIEDAEASGSADVASDLQRMALAHRNLADLIAKACDGDAASVEGSGRLLFESRLRHDLRTPLNAIKGYSEMLIEDMSLVDGMPFVVDLNHVIASVDQMLARIDRLAEIGLSNGAALNDAVIDDDDVFPLLLAANQDRLPAVADPQRLVGHILVVDDEPSNRDLLGRRLGRDGHRVGLAEDGAEALAMTREHGFDLILLDMLMPGLPGLEVLRRLKSSAKTRDIPVIVISALGEIDSVVQCIEAGAEDYLPKTFNPTILRARISACLEKKALRDREALHLGQLRIEKQRSEALLLNILPQSIVARMRGGESAIADRFDAVTILFCDLVGFTPLAARLTPTETVALLSQIFSTFDAAVTRWQVEKIKTIGDAYMVAGGIPQACADHAERVANLAIDMLADVSAIGRHYDGALSARIGIHTGEAVAGVIGTNRFAYDVWGDTVNTAARMESHGLKGRIHISQKTRQALGEAFQCEDRGLIDVKGKGAMQTFFLLGPTEMRPGS